MLPDFEHLFLSLYICIYPATLTSWGCYHILNIVLFIYIYISGHPHLLGILPDFEHWSLSLCIYISGHPHLLGILPDFMHWSLSLSIYIYPATLTCWGYYQILCIGFSLSLCIYVYIYISSHPHLLGVLPDFRHWSLSMYIYIWPPSLVGGTARFFGIGLSLYIYIRPPSLVGGTT